MLIAVKRKCPRCKNVFVEWKGGFVLKETPFGILTPCPSCGHWRTKVVR